jgi:hypothetical protein
MVMITKIYMILGLSLNPFLRTKIPRVSFSSFMSYRMKWILMMKIQFKVRKSKMMNMINLPKLCLPTQLLIQGQWWSYWVIQVLQTSQWYDLEGLYCTQRKQTHYNLMFLEWALAVDEFMNVCSDYFIDSVMIFCYLFSQLLIKSV